MAWQTVTEILNYRSFLNVKPQSVSIVGPLSPKDRWSYGNNPVPGKPLINLHITAALGVPIKEAARMDRIGTDQNASLSSGPLFLLANGGAFNLDNFYLRNAVFENVEIHYSGEPSILENVTFINCTFVFDNTARGRKLGMELLASSAVNFKSGV